MADGDVLSSFAAKDSGPTGLTWDGTNLWHCDFSSDTIYKLNPADGSIVSSFSSPAGIPQGLAWDGTNLWNGDSTFGNRKIYKLDPSTGNTLDSFATPDGAIPEGMVWIDGSLWVVLDGVDIFELDPSDGSTLSSFPSPFDQPWGLAWDGNYLWIGDQDTDKLYKMYLADQSVVYSFTQPGDTPRGLTWDGTSLWVVNGTFGDRVIRELEVNENFGLGRGERRKKTIDFPEYKKVSSFRRRRH